MMKNKITIYALISAAPLILVYLLFVKSNSNDEKFNFAPIKRGNIITTITSSGTVNPVTSVDVGTQVSGKIAKIFIDYNSHVKKGQLLAIIDTTALSLNVKNAKANLLKAQSQYDLAKTQYEQNMAMFFFIPPKGSKTNNRRKPQRNGQSDHSLRLHFQEMQSPR